jgi:hypothetical protein
MSKECTCPSSVYGGFKQGTGIALGFTLVAGVPLLLLLVFALPAYLGSLARAAGTPAVGPQQGGRILEMY